MMNHSFSQKEVNPPTQRIGHSWVVKKKKKVKATAIEKGEKVEIGVES